jgi:hypothetical protein
MVSENKENRVMKKVILVILILLLVTVAAAIAASRSVQTPVAMGMNMTTPGKMAVMLADIRARFTTGKDELQHSLNAKKEAKSFRMKTLLQLHPGQPLETVVDVSCPDRERFTTTIGDRAYHAVRIGDKAYVEQQDGTWTTQQTSAVGWSPCGDNPGEPAPWAVMNEGRDPSTILAKLVSNSDITRGAYVGTAGGNCQQWMLSVKMPGGASHGHGASGLRYTICIDPKGHLPVAVSMGNGGMVTSYYDWNKPIQIDAPEIQAPKD